MNSFSEKALRVTLILAGTNQVFPGTNSNTLVLTGLRMSAKVVQAARLATQVEINIYGMLAADMNALTVAWANPPIVLDHVVILEADDGNGFVQVFKGTIIEAQPEYRAAPDVYFSLLAMTGYFKKIQVDIAAPTSYPDAVAADVAIATLIDRLGFTAEISGAVGAAVLTNPYFSGSVWDQFVAACNAANADFYTQGGTILVTPRGLPRDDQPAVVLNASSGLIGYPVYERAGLNVAAIFNPAFLCGTPIQLESSIPSATGRWYPIKLQHVLESKMPRGQWLTNMQCLRVLV